MVGDEGDTPTRYELLSMVKKHSSLIGKTNVEEQDPSDVEMDPKFWHDVFDFYFIRGKESRGRQDDDLLFFVRKMRTHGDPSNESPDGVSPYFVRRWASELDKLLGDSSDEVDWRRSFYLNLIAHTSFTVTVAICSHEVLRNHQSGQDTPLSPIYKVVKTVYASPSRVNFHLDSKKEVETTPAYPDICFAVDDFDSTFDAVVLSSTDHCYCVLLNAHDGAAFPTQKEQNDCISSSDTPLRTEASSGNSKSIKITLFSGFVSYQMVREAYNAGKSQFGGLWSLGHSLGKQDRLYMKGPGGRGEVEVAVSGVIDQSNEDVGPFSPVSVSNRGFGIGSIVRKAASVASVAAKHAYAVASATTSHDDELMIPLKCCLMSISLPWEHIAYDLLFKGSPPVNL
ncbi:uncharacterized protein KIAA0930 homolog isoform X1 [Eucalyptus grandis]|uniref:uncharacterized protein KIAA0930 homolog isoform X1 n=1 Tax=Eucalyptus grandis TaxID=71139 RepID=UPI00192EF29B|nr:uncharacterized protein KIAA0930 homolog isoform X1 [Eucalyptus grandis]